MPATLTQIRQEVGRQLGPFAAGTSETVLSAAQIKDVRLASSVTSDYTFEDYWCCLPEEIGDDRRSRRVISAQPSTGQLGVDRAWSSASVPSGAAYELHGILEPIEAMAECVNAALKRLMVVVELTLPYVPPINGQDVTRQNVTATASWLTDPLWIRQVGYLTAGESRQVVDPFRNRRVRGSATILDGKVYLDHPRWTWTTNETVYLRCLKPAYAHCRSKSTDPTSIYGEKSDGLTNEDNQTEIECEVVAAGTIVEAANRSYILIEEGANTRLEGTVKRAARLFADYAHRSDPRNREDGRLTFTPALRAFGPSYAGYH